MAADAPRRRNPQASSPPPPPRSPIRKPFWRRALRRIFVWGIALALMIVIGVGIAVFVAAQSLPGYQELKSSQNGQMIVVRARDGTELVSLGPSYGKWMAYGQ